LVADRLTRYDPLLLERSAVAAIAGRPVDGRIESWAVESGGLISVVFFLMYDDKDTTKTRFDQSNRKKCQTPFTKDHFRLILARPVRVQYVAAGSKSKPASHLRIDSNLSFKPAYVDYVSSMFDVAFSHLVIYK
jgi:hypothetical protein